MVMFVAMVGWGKNTVCNALMCEGEGKVMTELGLEGRARVLEGDELKDGFWGAVDEALQDESVTLIILNRSVCIVCSL